MRAPEFWNGKSASAKTIAALLSPLGALYGIGVQARAARANSYRPKARVICIGNLTAGGTGKTPVAISVGRMLASRGLRYAFLTRGYGWRLAGPLQVDPQQYGADEVGDEPLLLAAAAPTIVARDRAAGAKLADTMGMQVIVMDDGFQNYSLAKDLSLVVVDAATGFGNGRLIPAGPLRESVSGGLARADGVVLVGNGEPELSGFARPVLRAHITPSAPNALRGRAVVAFAGIGRPEKFFQSLSGMGAVIVAAQPFADHHRYGTMEISALQVAADAAGAQLVTTEKDFVRLPPDQRAGILPVPVRAVFADAAPLSALLDRALGPREEHGR